MAQAPLRGPGTGWVGWGVWSKSLGAPGSAGGSAGTKDSVLGHQHRPSKIKIKFFLKGGFQLFLPLERKKGKDGGREEDKRKERREGEREGRKRNKAKSKRGGPRKGEGGRKEREGEGPPGPAFPVTQPSEARGLYQSPRGGASKFRPPGLLLFGESSEVRGAWARQHGSLPHRLCRGPWD